MTTAADTARALSAWFATAQTANMKIPTGWFGRPYDNFYDLVSATADGERLTIALDEGHVITIDGPTVVENTRKRFAIGLTHATRDWTVYGTTERRHEEYDTGMFEFLTVG